MFEILERSSGNVIGVRVSGKLLHEDYKQFVPKLEAIIKEHGSLRCVCELEDFHGIEFHALWDEMKFDVKHCRDIERCAIVGAKRWQEWMAKLGKLIFWSAEMKFFDASESDKAWEWVEERQFCGCGSTTESSSGA